MSLQIVVIEYPTDDGGHYMENVFDLLSLNGRYEQLTEDSFLLDSNMAQQKYVMR